MEHRWSERKPITRDAVLHHSGLSTPARLRDVSLEGAFVEVDPATILDGECEVEVYAEDSRAPIQRVPAQVVHRSERGVGLVFKYPDQSSLRVIRDMWIIEPAMNPDLSASQ